MSVPRRLAAKISPFLIAAGALIIAGCIDNPNIDTSLPSDVSNYSSCIAGGGACGGGRLCCSGTCKGGRCSSDASCTGSGGLCNSSGDCCGTLQCNPSTHACGNGIGCFTVGQPCQGGADCCGTLTCQSGSCH